VISSVASMLDIWIFRCICRQLFNDVV